MHKSVRTAARARQDAQLISFLVNTRVVTATVEPAGDSFNGKYQRGTDASIMKWACDGRPALLRPRATTR